MKVREGFVLTELGDDTVAVPVGDTAESFRGVIRMNKTSVAIWRGLESGKTEEEIASDLVERYDGVNQETALHCTRKVIKQLMERGVLE